MPAILGSGIVLYVSHVLDNINVNITLDKNTTTTRTFPPNYPSSSYNFSLYDIQLLPFGNHEVTVLILDWITGNTFSTLWFDYAAVNDTIPSTIQSPNPNSSGSGSGSGSSLVAIDLSRSHTYTFIYSPNVGAIVGGTVGGLLAIGVVIAMLLCFRRRRRKLQMEKLDAVPQPLALDWDSMGEGNLHASSLLPTVHATEAATTVPDPPGVPSTTTASPDVASLDHFQPSPQPTSNKMRLIPNVLHSTQNEQLTDDQADLVSDLWRANVAAADIARVIERMRAGDAADISRVVERIPAGASRSGDRNSGTSPPSYKVINS